MSNGPSSADCGLMLEEPHENFNVTQTYALFTAILCWVMQRIRNPTRTRSRADDRIAYDIFKKMGGVPVVTDPWRVHVAPTARIEPVERCCRFLHRRASKRIRRNGF